MQSTSGYRNGGSRTSSTPRGATEGAGSVDTFQASHWSPGSAAVWPLTLSPLFGRQGTVLVIGHRYNAETAPFRAPSTTEMCATSLISGASFPVRPPFIKILSKSSTEPDDTPTLRLNCGESLHRVTDAFLISRHSVPRSRDSRLGRSRQIGSSHY